MSGRNNTTVLFTWSEIHWAMSEFAEVLSAPLNLEPNDDVRPATLHAMARRDGARHGSQ